MYLQYTCIHYAHINIPRYEFGCLAVVLRQRGDTLSCPLSAYALQRFFVGKGLHMYVYIYICFYVNIYIYDMYILNIKYYMLYLYMLLYISLYFFTIH